MKVRELVTVWGFDIDQKPLDKMEDRIRDLKGSLKGIGLTVAATAATLFGITKTFADAGEEAGALAELYGMGVEEFQLWRRAAENAEVPVEMFNLSLRNLKSNAAEAGEAGSQVGKVFRRLGIQTRGANGEVRDTNDLLMDVARSFQRIPKNQQGRLAEQLFGARSQRFLLFLRQGPAGIRKALQEGRDLQFAITPEQAEAADKFNDSLSDTILVLKSVRNMMGAELLPVFGELLKDFRDWFKTNREVIRQNVVGLVRGLVAGFRAAAPVVLAVAAGIAAIVQALGGSERVVKAFVAGWAVFKGFQIVSLLAGIVQQAGLAAASMTTLGKSAILAQLRIFAVVLLAAALIEDVVGFFQGRDSVLGRIVDAIKYIFSDLAELAKWLLQVVTKYSLIGQVVRLIHPQAAEAMQASIQNIGSGKPMMGGVPMRPGAAALFAQQYPTGVLGKNVTVENPQINVTVNGGTTNEETGAIVAQASKAALEDVLRGAERDHPEIVDR